MSASGRHALSRSLYAFALLAHVVGLLARPLAAVACDVEDSRNAIAAEQGAAMDSSTQDTGGDCCASAACGECCASVPLVTAAIVRLAAYLPLLPQVLPEPPDQFDSSAYPVNSRPPLHA